MRAYIDMKPGSEPLYWEDGAHFQAWYPVSEAKALQAGKIIGRQFLGSKIILYRDAQGRPVAQTAYCAHLGADLSDGDMVDGQVRCPYHHWRYGPDGHCTHIASGHRPPRSARLFNYPVAEKWGLIWVFNGTEPLYEVPSFDGDESDYLFTARERPDVILTDSWIQGTNGLDFQHLTAVHNMPETAKPGEVTFNEFTIEYPLTFMSPDGFNRMYAANCLVSHWTLPLPTNCYVIFCTNAPEPGRSESFWVAAVKQMPDETRAQAEERLAALDQFLFGFFGEDEHVLNGLRLRLPGKAKLIKDDFYLGKFFTWLDRFPRAAPLD
ncbi:Rieske_RO_Alpha_N domain containing protein [Sphingobium cupriresistens]